MSLGVPMPKGMKERERAARIRLEHAFFVLGGNIEALRSCTVADLPTPDTRQAAMTSLQTVIEQLTIIDAFRFERENEPDTATEPA